MHSWLRWNELRRIMRCRKRAIGAECLAANALHRTSDRHAPRRAQETSVVPAACTASATTQTAHVSATQTKCAATGTISKRVQRAYPRTTGRIAPNAASTAVMGNATTDSVATAFVSAMTASRWTTTHRAWCVRPCTTVPCARRALLPVETMDVATTVLSGTGSACVAGGMVACNVRGSAMSLPWMEPHVATGRAHQPASAPATTNLNEILS